MITRAQILTLFPKAKPVIVDAILDNWSVAEEAGITGTLRLSHFFSEIGHESGGLRKTEESLNFTTAKRIRETWPTRFKTDADAQPFVRKPMNLAIKVYGGRMGNAPSPSKDGWNYRGGGLMQTTGREGYRKMGFESRPEALRDPKTAFLTAIREWVNRGCNELADADDVVAVRRAINGGTIGIDDVRKLLRKGKTVFQMEGSPKSEKQPVKQPVAVENPPLSPAEIKHLQMGLAALGYPEVGNADGRFGTKTRAAILAFEADNGLPLTGAPTFDLMMKVEMGRKREVSATRAYATPADIAGKPAVAVTDTLQKIGTGLIATSGVGALLDGSGDIQKVIDSANKLKALTETLASLSPWVIGAAAGFTAIYLGKKLVSHLVNEYREGRLL